MLGRVANTDYNWYRHLSQLPSLEEVNFWKPSAARGVKMQPGAPFIFRLKAPHKAICGFAFFYRYTPLPLWYAWETFGEANGVASLAEMQGRISRLRQRIRYQGRLDDARIGCVLLLRPVLFPRSHWVRQPDDWSPRTQSDKSYDLNQGEGRRVWQECLDAANMLSTVAADLPEATILQLADRSPTVGSTYLAQTRLGQGTFRVAVTQAYDYGCAVTTEHSLPALEAAHIKPVAAGGPHAISNGLLLRADFHRLFDRGYITITPSLHVEVSGTLRDDFENGHSYYPHHGQSLRLPRQPEYRPSQDFLSWHNGQVYRG